jgi:hypothetical protein
MTLQNYRSFFFYLYDTTDSYFHSYLQGNNTTINTYFYTNKYFSLGTAITLNNNDIAQYTTLHTFLILPE